MKPVVTSREEVIENIRTYCSEVAASPHLAARIGMHPAWYAFQDSDGRWLFGPSKFVGYRGATADDYLAPYDRKDGREAEPALRPFSLRVEESDPLFTKLKGLFREFAARYGKTPKSSWRVSVVGEGAASGASKAPSRLSARIAFDPEICGGRPRVAGTRIRVSDIIAALGAGESIAEILEDFPYLQDADIYAALDYAAKAVDHRVLRAA